MDLPDRAGDQAREERDSQEEWLPWDPDLGSPEELNEDDE